MTLRAPWLAPLAVVILLALPVPSSADDAQSAADDPAGGTVDDTADGTVDDTADGTVTLLDAAAFLALIQASEVVYRIERLDSLQDVDREDLAAAAWPAAAGDSLHPRVVVGEDGSRTLERVTFDQGCRALLAEAEPFFRQRDYQRAGVLYRRAAERYPDCYLAFASVGDSLYFAGHYQQALGWYERVIARNPYDFLGHFYRANTLFRLGRMEQARAGYVQALARRPHRATVLKVLRSVGSALGARLHDEPFQPRALARREGEAVAVYADLDRPDWLAYGLCKAAWIGEPQHRAARGKSEEEGWTNVEERECLLAMLAVYRGQVADGSAPEDPALERLYAAAEEGLLDAYLWYEIAYRASPDITVLLPEALFDDIVRYVDRFVIPLVPPPPPADADAAAGTPAC